MEIPPIRIGPITVSEECWDPETELPHGVDLYGPPAEEDLEVLKNAPGEMKLKLYRSVRGIEWYYYMATDELEVPFVAFEMDFVTALQIWWGLNVMLGKVGSNDSASRSDL